MKRRTWLILAGAAGLVAVVLLANVAGLFPRSETASLSIGVIFPLSGDAASYGEKGQRAIELAHYLAEQDQTCGAMPVELAIEDSAASPTTGIAAFQKLRSSDHVDVVIGDIVSAVTLAVAPLAEQSRTLLLSPTSSAPAITDAGPYVFRIWPSDLAEGSALAELAISRGLRRVAIMHMTNDYGAAIADIFERTLVAAGGEVVLKSGYNPDTTEFRATLTRIRSAAPDAVYIAGYFADTAIVVGQARSLGIAAQLLGTTAIEDQNFLNLAGDAAEGMIYPLATGFDAASTDEDVVAFVTGFRERFGETPGWVEAAHFDAYNLVCAAAASISPSDPSSDALRAYFEAMPPFDGVGGRFSFDANGDVVKPIVFRTVRDGQFVPLN
jgi:branched-chain amino acid transport system substrate-binding protein